MLLSAAVLAGCGLAPSESKLLGAWQMDLPHPQKLVYVFQKDHTYAMMINHGPGVSLGRWKLEGGRLTMTMGAFAAYGMTNSMTAPAGLGAHKVTISWLTDSAMTWRGGVLGTGLKLKRVPVPTSTAPHSI